MLKIIYKSSIIFAMVAVIIAIILFIPEVEILALKVTFISFIALGIGLIALVLEL